MASLKGWCLASVQSHYEFLVISVAHLIWLTLCSMLLGFFKFCLPLMEVASSTGVSQINRMVTSTGEETSEVSYRITFKGGIFPNTR